MLHFAIKGVKQGQKKIGFEKVFFRSATTIKTRLPRDTTSKIQDIYYEQLIIFDEKLHDPFFKA